MEIKTERRPGNGDQTSFRVKVENGPEPGSRLNPGSDEDVSILRERGSFSFKDVSNIKSDTQPAQLDTVEVIIHIILLIFVVVIRIRSTWICVFFCSGLLNQIILYRGLLRHPSYEAHVLPKFRGFSQIFNQLFSLYAKQSRDDFKDVHRLEDLSLKNISEEILHQYIFRSVLLILFYLHNVNKKKKSLRET